MIKWYRSEIKNVTWSIGENWRFLKSYEFASEELKTLGRIVGFQGRQFALVLQTGKFFRKPQPASLLCSYILTDGLETAWRKNPTHQGGYILDGGVHYMAGLRQLLEAQPGNNVARVSAFSNQVREYLPPVDTVNAVFKLESGVTGTFQISVGSSLKENSWTVACEGGWIKVEDSKVTVCRDGQEVVKEIPNERSGVPPEVREWGRALAAGKALKAQEPEPALADLELVSTLSFLFLQWRMECTNSILQIELMLRSGEANGKPMDCAHQKV